MREIRLSAEEWTTAEDFYAALLGALGAPEWHGHTMDALWDSMTGGDINAVNPPYRVRIQEADLLPAACAEVVDQFEALAAQARLEGLSIAVVRQ